MINTEIIQDSISPQNNRITTFILTIPQIIVKELLRHRMFSFSSSSMRAIPFNKVVQNIEENMFVPLAFQAHHSGMQGSKYLIGEEHENAKQKWIDAGVKACEEAKKLYNIGITKQLCSRIIEPFGYAKILVTATEFTNFFELRCPKYYCALTGETYWSKKDFIHDVEVNNPELEIKCDDTELRWIQHSTSGAEIHIQALAENMWDAINESVPEQLGASCWHIPFKDNVDMEKLIRITGPMYGKIDRGLIKVAVARAARLSYITHEGEIDYVKDIKLHDQLLENKHLSCFEHCALTMSDFEYEDFYKGDLKESKEEFCFKNQGWCNNFKGFIPYRYLVENK